MKGKGIQTISFLREYFFLTESSKVTNLIIRWFLAGPLWFCVLCITGDSPKINVRVLSTHWYPRNHQLAPSVGRKLFHSLLLRDKGLMVRTRSRATSPGHQGSSNPHRDRQSAPVMQSSAQYAQSMADAMAELTRQNQELRMEIINMRRQTHEEREGGQTQSHGGRENTEIGS